MSDTRLQSILFGYIKKLQPKNTAAEIQAALGLSRTAAFDRMNGKTALSIDETYSLCNHFKVKLEDIIPKSDGQVVINMASIDKPFSTQEDYPNYLIRLLTYINSLPNGEIIYLTNEIPVTYFFSSPLLGAFKMYMWSRNTFHQQDLVDRKFQPQLIMNTPSFKVICEQMLSLYENFPRTEIWTKSVLNRSISQIEYCKKANLFFEEETPLLLIRELKKILKHNLGSKPFFTKGAKERKLYFQPYFSAEDIILIRSETQKRIIATFFNPDYFISSDRRLIKKSEKRLSYFIEKSYFKESEADKMDFYTSFENQLDAFAQKMEKERKKE